MALNKEKRNFIIFIIIAGVIAAGIILGAVLLNLPSENEPAVFATDTTVGQTVTAVTEITTAEAVFPLDLNTASKDELMQLEGIGEVLAERIIAYRDEKPFGTKEEILFVEGIGNVVFEKIRYSITVSVHETTSGISAVTSAEITETFPTATTPQTVTEASVSATTAVPITTTVSPVTTSEITAVTTTETTVYVPELPIDINSAALEDFMYLEGIGESLARRIISYREQVGGFYDVYELYNVNGIGDKIMNCILPYIWADTSGLPPRVTTVTTVQTTTVITTTQATTVTAVTTTITEPEPRQININTAGASDFASLPGMNMTLAENIIKLRESIGGSFASIYEILYADGVTDGIFNKILPYITV